MGKAKIVRMGAKHWGVYTDKGFVSGGKRKNILRFKSRKTAGKYTKGFLKQTPFKKTFKIMELGI